MRGGGRARAGESLADVCCERGSTAVPITSWPARYPLPANCNHNANTDNNAAALHPTLLTLPHLLQSLAAATPPQPPKDLREFNVERVDGKQPSPPHHTRA